MKKRLIYFVFIVLFSVNYSCSQDAETYSEVLSRYNESLTKKQHNYRLLINDLNSQLMELDISSLEKVANNTIVVRQNIDSIIDYIAWFNIEIDRFGNDLKRFSSSKTTTTLFDQKWEAYHEGVMKVMKSDIESILPYISLFDFLLYSENTYQIIDDVYYFETEEYLNIYKKYLWFIEFNASIQNQEKIREETIKVFTEAIVIITPND